MDEKLTKYVPRCSNVTYVSLLSVYEQKINPVFFERCGSVPTQLIRKCIAKNEIPEKEILFVFNNSVSNSKNSRATPYVTETYAKEWIYVLDRIVNHRNNAKEKNSKIRTKKLQDVRVARKAYDANTLSPLPKIVELDESEGFKDEHGNTIRIEMRGERTVHGMYFKASDLHPLHNRVEDTVQGSKSDYEYNTHYVFYIDTRNSGTDVSPDKVMYLTYLGVVKLLMCSRAKKAEHFQRWAITTLFTHQFGSASEKDSLASNLLGVSPATIQSVFRCYVDKLPCIYLYVIGKVIDIKEYCDANNDSIALDGYSDNDLVYKFGCADDIERRTREHNRTYGKMTTTFGLKHFTYVDKTYMYKAEATLKHFFQASKMHVNDKKRVELAVIPKDKEGYVKEMFHNIFTMYAGSTREIQHELIIKNQIIEEKEHIISVKDELIRAKDALLEARTNEIRYLKIIAKLDDPC